LGEQVQIVIIVIAALSVLTAALIGEVGNWTSRAAVVSQISTPNDKSLTDVQSAKLQIEKIKSGSTIQDLTLRDPSDACKDRAKELARDRGRAKYAWAENVKIARTRKIRTAHGNPAFLVNVKADGERTFCAVIFENSTCKVDMLTCAEEQKHLQVARFGKLAAK
jgi:hypothetical protein